MRLGDGDYDRVVLNLPFARQLKFRGKRKVGETNVSESGSEGVHLSKGERWRGGLEEDLACRYGGWVGDVEHGDGLKEGDDFV